MSGRSYTGLFCLRSAPTAPTPTPEDRPADPLRPWAMRRGLLANSALLHLGARDDHGSLIVTPHKRARTGCSDGLRPERASDAASRCATPVIPYVTNVGRRGELTHCGLSWGLAHFIENGRGQRMLIKDPDRITSTLSRRGAVCRPDLARSLIFTLPENL